MAALLIGISQIAHHPESVWAFLPELHKGRLAHQVATKKHAVANLVPIQLLGQFGAAERCIRLHGKLEAKPAAPSAAAGLIPGESVFWIPASGVGRQGELEHVLMGRQTPAQSLPVLLAALNEIW